MEWGIQKTRMIKILERLSARGWLDWCQAWLTNLSRRWPSVPWRSARIEVQFYEHAMSYWLVHGRSRVPVSHSEALANGLPWVLLLPESRVLKRNLSLPLVKGADLTALLAHEVSRHTPYQAVDVSFTWRQNQNPTSNSLDIDLWVLPLTQWQRLTAELPDLSSRCRQVDVELPERQSAGINLLPKSDQARFLAPRVQMALVLMAVALLALLWGMQRVLQNRADSVAQWQDKITVLESEVRPVRQLQAMVKRTQRMQEFIQGLNRRSPSKLAVLAQLSQCLPVDVVLDRLSIQERNLTIDGMAASPEALVPALTCASFIKAPNLVGTMQSDTQNNNKHFSLQAQVQGGP